MPKTYNHLFDQIVSIDNLYDAFHKAQRGRRKKPDVLAATYEREAFLHDLHERLAAGTWRPEPYHTFLAKTEVKSRIIRAPTFHDRVVHHAICNVLMPLFENKFIFDSYAITPGKGTHRAVKRVQAYLRETHAYYLQCDVHHYYESVHHATLKRLLRRTIRDRRVLGLLDTLIDSYHSDETGEGIPIGAMTSQLFANLYLNELDHFLKDELGCKQYVRYMDDFILFGEKPYLLDMLGRIEPFLARLHLHLNDRTRLAPAKQGVDFAGYRTYVTHIKMRKRNVTAARRRFRRYERLYAEWRVDVPDVTRRVASFRGYACHADSYDTLRSVLGSIHLARHHST
ncbi:MAG: reverse transcriptase/maturase family protein [Selenomonas sp.]|uniref:reverse transcriptase/maturase family protein n=1 Tax=Selenomonas sp. TaxID=2053611 RepID=UPI0025CC51D1|nr:reverse transcriptase/maturase family protein [Selenomonas sp.]MCI6233229.1 reverse transcriptase/maturase family protein [Selenomonas sp.]